MVRFAEQLIAELRNMPDNLQMLIEIMQHERCVCIWGTGVAGQTVCASVRKLGICPICFINGSLSSDSGGSLLGLPVVSPKQIPKNAFVLVAADVKYGIHRLLAEQYPHPYSYIDPLLFNQYTADRKKRVLDCYAAAADVIDRVYEAFCDDRSKQTFRNVLVHRAVHAPELLWQVQENRQYFGNDLIPEVSGGFADCGAYDGDTLRAFLAQIGDKDYRYYAFEPEEENLRALRQCVRDAGADRVQIYGIGLWDRKKRLGLIGNDAGDTLAWKLGSCCGDDAAAIEVDALDHVLQNEEIRFIKMDIEGSELRALDGAQALIARCQPVLAISSYHELEHLWEVPAKICTLRPGCRLGCRHHSWNMADTVCYGI